MRILYYYWNENSCEDMADTLRAFGHQVKIFQYPLRNYLEDEQFSASLQEELSAHPCDFIFTFNYFPVISETAMRCCVKYVCWVYDCPHFTLYSKTVSNDCNYIFLFDRMMLAQVKAQKAAHVYHLPLAANVRRLNQKLGLNPDTKTPPPRYIHEISFVGSLYENNLYDRVNYLPDHLRGYLDGIMTAQKQIWGMDIITPLLDSALAEELAKYIKLEENPLLPDIKRPIFAEMLLSKITSDERIAALNLLAEFFPTALYSASRVKLCPKVQCAGAISYLDTMPDVFFGSKINLNITLRSITSGIPLRAIDILSCGGFLLTNYQPELAENLEAGTDFVYFEDFEDMAQKAAYFLSHESERQEIAHCGYKKIQMEFSYEKQVEKLLELSV